MNKIQRAIKILNEQGYDVVKAPNKKGIYYIDWGISPYTSERFIEYFNERELIKRAKIYRENVRPWAKNLKEERNYENRAKTKQDINRENWDNFSKNKLRADGNPWNWD